MVYKLLHDLLQSICQYLIENLCVYVLFSVGSFPGFDIKVMLSSRNDFGSIASLSISLKLKNLRNIGIRASLNLL